MAQIIVRQLPNAAHSALKAKAAASGKSAEALAREILVGALLPEARPRLGDQLAAIWSGTDVEGDGLDNLKLARGRNVYTPPEFE